jgi:hypothetical protein
MIYTIVHAILIHNGKKKEKRTNNDLQITTQKTKDRATRIQLKINVNSCDLGQVGSFLRVLRFPPPIKLTSNDIIINIVPLHLFMPILNQDLDF